MCETILTVCGSIFLCLTGIGILGILVIIGGARNAPVAPPEEKFRLGE